MNPKVDFYFAQNQKWQHEIALLRTIVLDCQLNEELKWGCPCYTYAQKNVVLIHVFKAYCALLFFKGALLQDPDAILIQQTQNVQAARQIRFTTKAQITALQRPIKNYVYEAIEVEKSGIKVVLKKTAEFKVAEEFEHILAHDSDLKKAFEALTPGRQRAYHLYFSTAKQSKTRLSRIDNSLEKIRNGKRTTGLKLKKAVLLNSTAFLL